MSFANPIFLWGLLAVPLPVLLHLFFKRRKSRVAFSTLQFFQHRKKYLAHRRNLRELLLLLIRTLALLCLVMALSRVLFQSTPYAFASKTNVAIVLDDTLSMDRKLGSGSTAFELAAQKAEEVLDTLAEGDAAALVFLSGRPGIAMTRKRQLVRQLVQDARVTGGTGSYSAALKQALGHLAADGRPNREIFVVSDFQSNQAPSKPVELDAVKGLRIYFLPVVGDNENLSVDGVALSTRPQMVNKRMLIPYTIRNHGENDAETEVTLSVGSETVRTVTVAVPAGKSVEGRFEFVPDRAGVLNGAVRITDRHLALDNSRNFTVNVCENIRALLLETDVASRIRPFHFLKMAVDPGEGGALNGIQTEQGFVQELSAKELEKHHVVVLSNPQPLEPQAAALLTRYMANGGTVLVFAGAETDARTFAAFDDARLRGLFGAKAPADFSGVRFKGPLQALNEVLQMDLLKWQRVQALSPSPAGIVLAESHGHVIMAEEKLGSGSLIACAFSSRRDYCNWPELKSFPIAMIHLLTYAAHDPQQNAGIECGRLLRLTSGESKISLGTGDGKQVQLPVDKGEAVFADTWNPGIVTSERATPRSVAVNPVPAESILATLEAGKLSGVVAGKVSVLKTDAGVDSQIRSYRQGSDLTGFFLLLVMLLLLLEILLGNAYLFSRIRVRANALMNPHKTS